MVEGNLRGVLRPTNQTPQNRNVTNIMDQLELLEVASQSQVAPTHLRRSSLANRNSKNLKSIGSRGSMRSRSSTKHRDEDNSDQRMRDVENRRLRSRTSFDISNLQDDDERAIFDLITGSPDGKADELAAHLERTKTHLDITALFNSDGHTALTLAASEGKIAACHCILDFVKRRTGEIVHEVSVSSSSTTRGDPEQDQRSL